MEPLQTNVDVWMKTWELLEKTDEKTWDEAIKHVRPHRTVKEKAAVAEEQQIVMEGHDKADELAKEGADAHGGRIAEARWQHVGQMRTGARSNGNFSAFSCAGRGMAGLR